MNRPLDPNASSDLREYVFTLWRRKWSVLAIAGVVLVTALTYSYRRTDIYSSTAEVLVRPVNLDPTNPPSAGEFMNLEPERRLAVSVEVADLAAKRLHGLPAAGVSVSAPHNTNTLSFQSSSPDPKAAQRTAQAFAEAYLEFRLSEVLDDLRAASAPLEERISELTTEIDDVQDSLSSATTESQRTALQIRFNSLFAQRATLEQRRNDLILPENLQVGRVLRAADLPVRPSSPDHRKAALFALFVGLALGVVQAFVRDRLDPRLRGSGDLEAGAGAPVLAVVPRQRGGSRSDGTRDLVTVTDPDGGAAQSYKVLRATVLFLARSIPLRSLLITSANPGEGKTLTTANLGVAIAQSGRRVTLVSADLYRPMLEKMFSVDALEGVADVVWGRRNVGDVVQPLRGDQLSLVPSGVRAFDASELLGGDLMGRMLTELAMISDFVLIDTPPVLSAADALTLAPLVDAVIIVADARRTTYEIVQQARVRLEHVGANVIGAVLNNADRSLREYAEYGEYSRYARRSPAAREGAASQAAPTSGWSA